MHGVRHTCTWGPAWWLVKFIFLGWAEESTDNMSFRVCEQMVDSREEN